MASKSADKMVKLPNGCWVLAERECDVCEKMCSTLDVEFHSVHNHPLQMACSKCRKLMDKWKPLPDTDEDDDDDVDVVPVKRERKKRAVSLPERHRRSQAAKVREKAKPKTFTFEMDTDISLEDLVEEQEDDG